MKRLRLVLGGAAFLTLAACSGIATQSGSPGGERSTGPPSGATSVVGARQDTATDVARQADERPDGGITVVGRGTETAAPDVARMVVGVEVTRSEVDVAFGDAINAMQEVLDAIEDAGIDDTDVRTEEISIRERRGRPPEPPDPDEGPPPVTGYTVTNLVQVTVRDLDRAGEVISAVVDAGGEDARVHGFGLELDDSGDLLQGARAAAFEDAEERARHYADLAGRELGQLVSVSEVIGAPGPGPVPEVPSDGAVAAPIEPGEQELTVRIQATWTLER